MNDEEWLTISAYMRKQPWAFRIRSWFASWPLRYRIWRHQREFTAEWRRWNGTRAPGLLAHYCPEWDDLPIDEHSEEFSCCSCEWNGTARNEIAQLARERQRHLLDERLAQQDALERELLAGDEF